MALVMSWGHLRCHKNRRDRASSPSSPTSGDAVRATTTFARHWHLIAAAENVFRSSVGFAFPMTAMSAMTRDDGDLTPTNLFRVKRFRGRPVDSWHPQWAPQISG